MAQATFEVSVLVEAYRLAKREEAAAKKRVDELKSALGEAFETAGSDEFAEGDRVLISRTLVERSSLDAKLIEKLAPVAFAKARKFSKSYRINLGK